ncbi:MAG: ATP-binding protein [Bacteroidales bacterium]|jgi:MinD superfamily P-loop ATPase|nr:ATP-binding protein [Bacteroidales bacterium]
MKIAIASGKGGTGKTTLSTNLTALFAETENVVLTDLDVEEPNSGLFINGILIKEDIMYKMIPNWNESTCSLCGACQKNCNFHAVIQLGPQILVFPELCHSCYACSELCPTDSLPMIKQRMGQLKQFKKDKITFVESRLDVGQEQAVPLIGQTIEYIEKNFPSDIVRIFDSPPGTSCPVIEATKDANFIILVTEPTPFGLHDMKLAVETMKELKKDFGVVVNRYGIGNDEVIDYCKENNIPILAKIPNTRKVAELYSKGELVYTELPEVKLELQKIKNYILNLKINN